MYFFLCIFSQKNKVKVFSIGILFLLFFSLPFNVFAANLSLNPTNGSFEVGDKISLKIIASSSDVSFNAVSGVVSFSPSIFSVESIFKTNSVLNFWVTEPTISGNTIKFEGLALGGFEGSSGTIITINLRAIKAGSGQVLFQSGKILANDGEGTDITSHLTGASFSIKDATPKTQPQKELDISTEEILPSEVSQPIPSLKAPEIMLGTKYGVDAIFGMSDYPKAQVLTTFVSEDGTKIFILGFANTDGSFNLLIPNSLRHGQYTVNAVMIKEDKTNSDISNTIIIKVGSIISDVSLEVWLVIVFLFLSIFYLLLRTYYHVRRIRNENKFISGQKLQEAEKVIHKSFDLLREDATENYREKFTSAEHKHMSEIKKDIGEAERIIEKKLKDIGS